MSESANDDDQLEKDIIFVLGTITGLVERGLVSTTDPCGSLTEAGMEQFRALKATGYMPTPERITAAVTMFRKMDEDATPEG